MLNNLGATTEMELTIVARHAMSFLESKGFSVERMYAGTFLSSLDMAAISITVLGVNDERLRWLAAAITAPTWPNALKQRPGKPLAQIVGEVSTKVS
jgi:dihydroxyacetone kinase